MKLTFVETLIFTARWNRRFDDAALRGLQTTLMENPLAGAPIPGCSLLRKMRFADPGRNQGKRGGVRVIYLHTPEASRVDLITVYGKDEMDDMSKDDLALLCSLARSLRAQLSAEESRRSSRRKGGD